MNRFIIISAIVLTAAPMAAFAQAGSTGGTIGKQDNNVALDGHGRNSPFAGALLKTIEQPGLPISDVMIAVRNEVIYKTGKRQVPWDSSSLTGQFYFVPPPATASTPPATKDFELDFWDSIKNEKNPRLFEAYLNRYPNGACGLWQTRPVLYDCRHGLRRRPQRYVAR